MENQSFTSRDAGRITSLTKYATEQFNRKYGNCLDKSHWRFMVNDYYATGEGRTISLMITQALPGMEEDFDTENYGYQTVTSKEYRAIREFYEVFGEFDSHGLEFLPEDHFFGMYANCLPPLLQNIKNDSYYEFYTHIHFNLS